MLQKQTLLKIFSFFEDVIFFSGWGIFIFCSVFGFVTDLLPTDNGKFDRGIDFGILFYLLLTCYFLYFLIPKFLNENPKTKLKYIAVSALFFPLWMLLSDLTSDWIYYLED